MKESIKGVYVLKTDVRELINIISEAPTEGFKNKGLTFNDWNSKWFVIERELSIRI